MFSLIPSVIVAATLAFIGSTGSNVPTETPAPPAPIVKHYSECLEDEECWDVPENPLNNNYNGEEKAFDVEADAWDSYGELGLSPDVTEDGLATSYVGSYNTYLPELSETQFTVDSHTTPGLVHIFESTVVETL